MIAKTGKVNGVKLWRACAPDVHDAEDIGQLQRAADEQWAGSGSHPLRKAQPQRREWVGGQAGLAQGDHSGAAAEVKREVMI